VAKSQQCGVSVPRRYQPAVNFFGPRRTKFGRHCGLSTPSSFSSGSRHKSAAMAISASIRASWAPWLIND
jgi:hypothetical protein